MLETQTCQWSTIKPTALDLEYGSMWCKYSKQEGDNDRHQWLRMLSCLIRMLWSQHASSHKLMVDQVTAASRCCSRRTWSVHLRPEFDLKSPVHNQTTSIVLLICFHLLSVALPVHSTSPLSAPWDAIGECVWSTNIGKTPASSCNPLASHSLAGSRYLLFWIISLSFGGWTYIISEGNQCESYCDALGMFFAIIHIFSKGSLILWKENLKVFVFLWVQGSEEPWKANSINHTLIVFAC